MKKIVLVLVFGIALAGCKVDKDLEPALQNEVSQFSFVKMTFDGEYEERNLSFYGNGFLLNRVDWTDEWTDRTYDYRIAQRQFLPEYNSYAELEAILVYFTTRTANSLQSRVGKKFAIASEDNRDNYVGIGFKKESIIYALQPSPTDSFTYVEIKDTLIDNSTFELTHLRFDDLTFVSEDGLEVLVEDLELRQVIR